NLAWADSFSSLNKKGNKAYQQAVELSEKGKKNEALEAYERALKYYRDAEIEKPESPELSFNIGNVNYQQEKYQDALEKYYKALSVDEPESQAATYYNMGNALYRSGKYQEAIQAYQKCLDITPDDEDAKYNIEFVRKKMKEMLDREAKRQQQQQGQQQDQKSKEQKQSRRQEEKQQQPAQSQEEQEKQKQQQQKQEQMQPKEGMTKEDAERILNALKDDEKEIQKKQQRFTRSPGRKGGKDW
ncbi:MAG: tetratricopeptide repeat protein, partial [Candidatus Zixiibacteriota bacterium]